MSKKVLYSKKIFDAQAMGIATVQSIEVDVPFLDNISFQVSWTGNAVGTFQVLASVNGTTFDPIAVSMKPAAGSDASFLQPFQNQGFQKVKLQYTGASGSGVLNAWCGGKEI